MNVIGYLSVSWWTCFGALAGLFFLMGCQQESGANTGTPDGTAPVPDEVALTESQATWSPMPSEYVLSHAAYFSGSCDGSGAVALDARYFAAVNDESSRLLIYDRTVPGPPVQTINIRKMLELKKGEEADLEAMAKMKDLLFLIGSHSRDRDGKKEKERRKLLTLRFKMEAGTFYFEEVGDVYEDLMDDLVEHPAFRDLDLKQSTKASGDDPHGFNIEGLCEGADERLWIGFRGPEVDGKALMVPLLNPVDVAHGAHAQFGSYVLLDLQGRVIRDLAAFGGQVLVVADSNHSGLGPALYTWSDSDVPPHRLSVPGLEDIDPEALILFPDSGLQALQFLSDDGGRRVINKDCKDWEDASMKRFRSLTFEWRQP